ncbi:MAG: calcium/sodium antiporter [Bdellovibrionaceae bacterium]|nr:calcium/sodium antiporter [Pseudobdellovibrionaceae bacterium]MDW8190311.1 calcium/sodium antiporter [Pseudobdellovibrionaceae bacterium]
MIKDLLLTVVGFAGLIWGAEWLVRGAAKLALKAGLSQLVVGLTIVAAGTSAPELAASLRAAWVGSEDLAIGNVVGSNIFNILGVLGVSALVRSLSISTQVLRQEIPIMLGTSVLFIYFLMDLTIQWRESWVLALLMISYFYYLIYQSRSKSSASNKDIDDSEAELLDEIKLTSRWDSHWSIQLLLVIAGSTILSFGADFLIKGATGLALKLDINERIVGLTLIAVGTSLPELTASIIAAARDHKDIALGNVIGSNTFNILGCVGLSGVVSGGDLPITPDIFHVDVWIMLAASFSLLPLVIPQLNLSRREGIFFILSYAVYSVFLFLQGVESSLLPTFQKTLTNYVIPIVIVALTVRFTELRFLKKSKGG